MSYSDDDIQFLGGTEFKPSKLTDKQQLTSRRWWIGIVALAFIALSAATFYFWQKANSHTLAFDYPLSHMVGTSIGMKTININTLATLSIMVRNMQATITRLAL